jgi:hypothetical protein
LRRFLVSTSRAGTFSHEDLDRYAAEWNRAGRLHAMLNYYHAHVRQTRRPLGSVRPTTLILWGRKDQALDFPLAEVSLATWRWTGRGSPKTVRELRWRSRLSELMIGLRIRAACRCDFPSLPPLFHFELSETSSTQPSSNRSIRKINVHNPTTIDRRHCPHCLAWPDHERMCRF